MSSTDYVFYAKDINVLIKWEERGNMRLTRKEMRLTRKEHICHECKNLIPKGTKCYWFKTVAFKESDIGRNEWQEFYICSECDLKLRVEM